MISLLARWRRGWLLGLPALVLACSKSEPKTTETAPPATATAAPAPRPTPAPAPAAPALADTTAAGFDISQVPVVNPKLGGFPYFSLLDGYHALTREENPGNSEKNYLKDVAFDRYEFFDGTRVVPVEGRLRTVKQVGKGASFYQAMKTYEQLVKDLGGVTVWEGKGQVMTDKKLQFTDGRHRGNYRLMDEQMGVYVLRTPDREIWVEPYKTWDDNTDNFWLTIVERKALPMTAKMMPAEEMKKALDANGHVAVYLNFDTDQATLRPDAGPGIQEIARLLQQDAALKLAVEGHTDNAGAFAHNQQLSTQRAQTVVAALTAQGIGADRLQPKGLGQTKPIADNATEEGKAKNRRVELVKI